MTRKTKQMVIDELMSDMRNMHGRYKRVFDVCDLLITRFKPQVITLPAKPEPIPPPIGLEHIKLHELPMPEALFEDSLRTLINTYPGMLFDGPGLGVDTLVGYTLDKETLVIVPWPIYHAYEQECLGTVGWSEYSEETWYESITVMGEDEEEHTPDIPNPTRRAGVWKARQVAYYVGEQSETPELNYPVWANGTWG